MSTHFGKPYLQDEEATQVSLDEENLSVSDVKRIGAELRGNERMENRWRKYAKCGGLLLLFSVLCNFAMMWTA